MGGSSSKQEEIKRKEQTRQQERNEAVDRLRQAIYGGNARLPTEVQSISKQRQQERQRKEEMRQQQRNEAKDRLRQVIYGVYAKLPAEIESLSKQREEIIQWKEDKVQGQSEAADRLKQAIYGNYPGLPTQIQSQIEQQRRRLELERLQHEQMMAFQSFMELELKTQERKRAENLFIDRLKKNKVFRNLDLLNDFRKAFNLTPLNSYPDKPYNETELLETSEEYILASSAFRTSNRPFFRITKIIRVDNTFHVLQYKMMKDKYRNCYTNFSSERLMFHGTKREYLDSICTYNFDRSKVRNHKFGHGISFATDSFYATHYHHDNKRSRHKVMIIAQVFFGEIELSTADMIIPSGSRYTSANRNGSVIVKYDDASFYPLYIVYYDGFHPTRLAR